MVILKGLAVERTCPLPVVNQDSGLIRQRFDQDLRPGTGFQIGTRATVVCPMSGPG